MKEKQIGILINIAYVASTLMILFGCALRLIGYIDSHALPIFGFMLGAVTSSFETHRLKEKIKRLEEQVRQNNEKQ